MMAVLKDGMVKEVEDEKELKNKQIRKMKVKPATNRHALKMALMKRGMSKSVGVRNAYRAS